MTKDRVMRLHRIYNALVSVMLVVSGALLIWGCLSIYYTGEAEPYTREIVAQTFARISVPVYITVCLVLLGFVFQLISPLREGKSRKTKKRVLQEKGSELAKNNKSESSENGSEGSAEILSGLWKKIRNIRLASSVIILIALCGFLIYSVNGENFKDGDITGSVIRAMWILIPVSALSFGVKLYETVACEKLSKKAERLERQLLKDDSVSEYIMNGKKKEKLSPDVKKKLMLFVRIVLVVAAAAFIVFGLICGGTADVLTKAMNICTECIGLG